VAEFPLVLECKLIKQVDLGTHTQFIGEILDVKIDQEILDEEGKPDPEKVSAVIYTPGIGRYFELGKQLATSYQIGKRFQ
jgi:flavin reductase (DIM6/NTAB) family NADH-FMN oxidoreductase RutF